jgi:hypothetical protein
MSTTSSSFSYCVESDVCYRTLSFIGYPHYRVGSDGSFWSRLRPVRLGLASRYGEWRLLKPCVRKNNRSYVHLQNGSSEVKQEAVYRLILLAFVGPCPEGMIARHFPDNNPQNNKLENLSWGTHKQNQNDRKIHGTSNQGEKAHFAKLTASQVREIRKLRMEGLSCKKISEMFRMHSTNIWQIVTRRSWKHVI